MMLLKIPCNAGCFRTRDVVTYKKRSLEAFFGSRIHKCRIKVARKIRGFFSGGLRYFSVWNRFWSTIIVIGLKLRWIMAIADYILFQRLKHMTTVTAWYVSDYVEAQNIPNSELLCSGHMCPCRPRFYCCRWHNSNYRVIGKHLRASLFWLWLEYGKLRGPDFFKRSETEKVPNGKVKISFLVTSSFGSCSYHSGSMAVAISCSTLHSEKNSHGGMI